MRSDEQEVRNCRTCASLRASYDAKETNLIDAQILWENITERCGGGTVRPGTSFAHGRLRARHLSNFPLGAKNVDRFRGRFPGDPTKQDTPWGGH